MLVLELGYGFGHLWYLAKFMASQILVQILPI